MNKMSKIFVLVTLLTAHTKWGLAQIKPSIAVVSLDTKGVAVDNQAMANIVRLEMEKLNQFEVLDRYDVADILKLNGIEATECFGKNAVIKAGRLLKADKMLTGSVEVFGEKLIFTFRLVDVAEERIETTSVMEFLLVEKELQMMALITLHELLGIPNDPHLVELLIHYNSPITTARTTAKLNGPRMGMTWTTGQTGNRLQAKRSEGGYDMFPVTSMFGYQFEKQYLSSGDFQALIETITSVNGLESGTLIPSISVLNGFRFNKTGWEFGLGPVFRLVKRSEGYFDENDNWIRISSDEDLPAGVTKDRVLDNRGSTELSVGLLVAVGKTFRSGYLNVPVNIFVSPRKEGTVVGISFGFNTSKKPKF